MKRKLFILSVLCICLAAMAGGTFAYFNAEGRAHNVITTGGVDIEVVEQMESGGVLVDFPKEGIRGVTPGTAVSKIVRVKNTGKAEAWLRVGISMNMKDAGGKELPLKTPEGRPAMSFVVMDGWLDGGDGYYYYRTPVGAGALTEALFEEVSFDGSLGNAYQNCKANLAVRAQAVQAANNGIPDGGDVTAVRGWPEDERGGE